MLTRHECAALQALRLRGYREGDSFYATDVFMAEPSHLEAVHSLGNRSRTLRLLGYRPGEQGHAMFVLVEGAFSILDRIPNPPCWRCEMPTDYADYCQCCRAEQKPLGEVYR